MSAKRNFLTGALALLLSLTFAVQAQPTEGAPITLRAQGAKGDGKTDDRAAIEAALNNAQGAPVDGEGLVYAVRGNIEVKANIDFRNATLVQTMDPPDTARFLPSARGTGQIKVDPPDTLRAMTKGLPVLQANGVGLYDEDPVPTEAELAALRPGIYLRTLDITGTDEKPISVKLDHITIDRGDHPESGGRNGGVGLAISRATPVQLTDCAVTGDGKGTGLHLSDSRKVRIERLNIHDMNWAPYDGDDVLQRLTAKEVRDDFQWNNFPIYEYRDNLKRFARVRIQEQLVGMFILLTQDVEVLDSKVERLQVQIGDQLYPLQCDGLTINRVKNIVVRNCEISKVWEGIDFTGSAGQDFLFEKCTATDILGWGFKLAHPKQNGKIVDCKAVRAGLAGFLCGGETEGLEWINCQALETGANHYWTNDEGKLITEVSGFRIEGNGDQSPLPRKIKVENCSAINKLNPGAMNYGMLNQANPVGREMSISNFQAEGAAIEGSRGFETLSAQAADATAEGPKSADQLAWEASVHPKYKTWPAMRYVKEDPTLPRALLIGDSISIGYTAGVREELKGKVNVLRIPSNGGSTATGLENLDQWLGQKKWDVIHFNWGLHDLKRRKEGSPNPDQLDVTGKIEVPVEQYVANLEKLVARLQQTGAKLIWASTTPIPEGAMGRVRGDEEKYNAAAAAVMRKHGVRIDDLYSAIKPQEAKAQPPKDVHFNDYGNPILARQVAGSILQALAQK